MTDWNQIVHQHGQTVWRTGFRLVGNDADALDCFQETFLSAVKLHRQQPVRDWSGLLSRLATARALDLLRTRYRQRDRNGPITDLTQATSGHAGPQQRAQAHELADRLRASLAQLPQNQAEVFCLCRLEGMTYQEAAQRMGLEASNVGVLLHRACKRLRHDLESVELDSRPAD